MTQIDWDAIERRALGPLLPFQRRTVDWAFDRLYGAGAGDRTARFLVADEVGLGKTLVAKAVTVKALRDLHGQGERADVVYICSNAEIAVQNLQRLRIEGLPSANFQKQGRLTLLPLINRRHHEVGQTTSLKGGFNFLSLTPATSFDVKGDVGQAMERALLCRMLQRSGIGEVSEVRWRNLFANRSSADSFQNILGYLDGAFVIDEDLERAFLRQLKRRKKLLASLLDLTEAFSHKGKLSNRSDEVQEEARMVIGNLRAELADVCIEALKPDLVVLDEFQRFPKLLDSEDEESALARKLFEFPKVRLLLLSATPYRLWADEVEDPSGTGHYKEFLRTIAFLNRDDANKQSRLQNDLSVFNLLLRRVAHGDAKALAELKDCRRGIEQQLQLVMSRTDRVPATASRDAMVSSRRTDVPPDPSDFVAYAGLQRVARELEQPDMVEYWRSAPYPLSFLSSYKLRDKLIDALEEPSPALGQALGIGGLFMPTGGIQASHIPNARTRHMAEELIASGLHRLPWVPPALPHYQLGGCFKDIRDAARTKRLLFSSWKMVPRAVSSVLEAAFSEQLQREGVRAGSSRHSVGSNDYALAYPSSRFAFEFNPLEFSQTLSAKGIVPTANAVQQAALERLAPDIDALNDRYGDVKSALDDGDWYWLGPLLYDLEYWEVDKDASDEVIGMALGSGVLGVLAGTGMPVWPQVAADLARRAQLAKEVYCSQRKLGRMPRDLKVVLARLAIAGPATCAMRSFGEVGDEHWAVAQGAASSIALALLGYLGHEQMVGQLEAQYPAEGAFWRRVLALCLDGGWGSVIDEYMHVLSHDRPAPLEGKSVSEEVLRWLSVPARITEVLSLKASVLRPEQLVVRGARRDLKAVPVTLRHARPLLERELGEPAAEGSSSMTDLRNAFNSPFAPLVLSSTSVGQEGLDFHWYCHAIVHWNVPGTPVDFEQRDGRIHRFRNHAVRRNIAHDFGGLAAGHSGGGVAHWQTLFDAATQGLAADAAMEGLKPSWIYSRGDAAATTVAPRWMAAQQGPLAEIERHVPTMPYSRDVEKYEQMSQALGCYRLVFAQPRQEDLLSHLMQFQAGQTIQEASANLAINLRPPSLGTGRTGTL